MFFTFEFLLIFNLLLLWAQEVALLLIEGVMSREESSAVILILVKLQEKYTKDEKIKRGCNKKHISDNSTYCVCLHVCECDCTSRSEWNLL